MYDMNTPNVPIEPPLEAPDSDADCATRDFAAGNRLYRARLALIGLIGAVVLAAIAQLSALAGKRQNLPIPSEKKLYLCLLNARVAVMVVGILGLVFVGLYLLVRRTRPDLWQKASICAWRAVLVAGVGGEMLPDISCLSTTGWDLFFSAFLPLATLWTLGGLYRKGMYLHEKSIARPWGRYIGGMLLRTILLVLDMVALAMVGFISFFVLFGASASDWQYFPVLLRLTLTAFPQAGNMAFWSFEYLAVAPVLYIAVALMEKCDFERRQKAISQKLFMPAEGGVYAVASLCAVVAAVILLMQALYSPNGSFIYESPIPAILKNCAGTLSALLLIPLYPRLLGLAQTVTTIRAPVWGLIGVRCASLLLALVQGEVLDSLNLQTGSITAYVNASRAFSYISFGMNLLHAAAVAWLVLVLIRRMGAPRALWAAPALRVVQCVLPLLGNLLLDGLDLLEPEHMYAAYSVCNILFLILVPVADLILFSRCRRPAVPPAGETLASEMPASEMPASEMLASEHKIPTELG